MIDVRLTRAPIEAQALVAAVASDGCGAISLFLGTVRDENDGRAVTGIEYSAYEAMAEKEARTIATEAAHEFGVDRIAMAHRLGVLAVGETSVAIAVAHPHRTAALDAGRYIIEELKRRVPVWKRELYTDGTREWTNPVQARAEVSP